MARAHHLSAVVVLALLVLGAACVQADQARGLAASDELHPATAELPLAADPSPQAAPHCRPAEGYDCHPLDPNACHPGDGCYLVEGELGCYPSFPGDFGDACDYLNTCDPGSMCVASFVIDGCTNDVGCCTSFCIVGAATGCPHHYECVEILEPGAPRCYEDLGVCVSV